MSKLIKLREWMTVPDTARYLSLTLEEEVTEADILRLALDRHLVLSVNFVNGVYARIGRIITQKELEDNQVPPEMTDAFAGGAPLPDEMRKLFIKHASFLARIGDMLYVFTDKNKSLDGVWDLPLIGSERLDIEHRYQQLTDGPVVTRVNIDGTFVRSNDSRIYRLLESWDENPFHNGSIAQLKEMQLDASGDNQEDMERLEQYNKDRKEYLDRRRNEDFFKDYYPAGTLPPDAVLVVRTSYLQRFIQSLIGEPEKKSQDFLPDSERNSLLRMLLGITVKKYGYRPGQSRSNVTGEKRGSIVADLQICGISLDADTVRKFVKEADEKFGDEILSEK